MPDFIHTNENEILQNRSAAENTTQNGVSFSAPALQLKGKDGILQAKLETVQKMGLEEEDPLQGKFATVQKMGLEEEEPLQGKFETVQKKSDGLPEDVQQKMEGSMGADFSNVNIHTNSSSAESLNALAYTQGNDIHFASGQYNPDSTAGQELIGHELAHVVQQSQGRVEPTIQEQGYNINNDRGLESEADVMGSKAAAFQLKKEDSNE